MGVRAVYVSGQKAALKTLVTQRSKRTVLRGGLVPPLGVPIHLHYHLK